MRSDGIYIKGDRPLVMLVNFGEVSNYLFEAINSSFYHFFTSIQNELDTIPEVCRISIADPIIREKGDEETAFFSELNIIPGRIVVGVTNKGIYDRSLDRYIFGFGGSCAAILSTYRFMKTNKNFIRIRKRLAKEVIKILSIATGVPHCANPNCILSYHQSVSDLDINRGLCDDCRKNMIDAINYLLKD
jgi:predicted Zn-dependent protease